MLSLLSDIDVRLLRVFVAVAQAHGLSAAQATLRLNQSTISIHLSTLEVRLGYSLCTRGRSGFALTEKGKIVFKAAQQLLGSLHDFSQLTQSLTGKLSGTINFAVVDNLSSLPNQPLSTAIGKFYQRDLNILLNFYVCSPNDIVEKLLNRELDLGIGYFGERQINMTYHDWQHEHQVIYCGKNHPLFAYIDPTEDDLLQTQWVKRSYIIPNLHRPIQALNFNAIANYMEAAAHLILAGTHIGYLPSHFAKQWVDQGLIKALRVEDLSYHISFSIVHRNAPLTKVIQALLDDLLNGKLKGVTTNNILNR